MFSWYTFLLQGHGNYGTCSGARELYKANVLVGDAAMLVYVSGVENTPITEAANSVEHRLCH
jgi:hypothetical protein